MRTVRTKVYKFNELSKEAKETAIKNFLNSYECKLYGFKEDCKDYLSSHGFENADIQYSLSHSQGDGLSFSAVMDIEKLIKEAKPDIKQSVFAVIFNNVSHSCTGNTGRYCFASEHDLDVTLRVYNRDYTNIHQYVAEIEAYIQDKYMSVCGTLEANGYAEIEYQSSKEYAIDSLTSNDYEFTSDGKQY